jgi:hypothetical protein
VIGARRADNDVITACVLPTAYPSLITATPLSLQTSSLQPSTVPISKDTFSNSSCRTTFTFPVRLLKSVITLMVDTLSSTPSMARPWNTIVRLLLSALVCTSLQIFLSLKALTMFPKSCTLLSSRRERNLVLTSTS